jgi:hypothetical protein
MERSDEAIAALPAPTAGIDEGALIDERMLPLKQSDVQREEITAFVARLRLLAATPKRVDDVGETLLMVGRRDYHGAPAKFRLAMESTRCKKGTRCGS